jgi:tryptophan-associated transmembrane protein
MHRRAKPSRARAVGAVVALAGGALAVIATYLTWIHSQGVSVATVSVPGDVTGLDTSLGWLSLAAGGVAVALSLIALLIRRRAGRVLGVLTILAGLVVVVVAGLFLNDPDQAFIDFAVSRAQDAGIATEGVDASLRQLMEVSGLTVDVELGAWIAAGGAALVVIGGGLMTASRLRPDAAYETPALLEHDASHPDESVLSAPTDAEEEAEPAESFSEPDAVPEEAREEEAPKEPDKKEPPDDVAMWRI